MAVGGKRPELKPVKAVPGGLLGAAQDSFFKNLHKQAAKNKSNYKNSPEYRNRMADDAAKFSKQLAEKRKSGKNASSIFVDYKSGPTVRLPGGKNPVAKKEALKKFKPKP
jgi:hypothetical protein